LKAQEQDITAYLVARCLKKDRQAQYQLYRQYSDAMYHVALRFMKDPEAARDALQDAFVDAFSKLHTYRKEATFGSWLKRIVINRCLNTLQKKRILTDSLSDDGTPEPAESPFELDSDQPDPERIRQIHEAIAQLPDGARVVLNLYLFEGYDHKEIAQILDVTESTSKAQYSKARKKVRQIIAQQLNTSAP
jgi:RNA polymerase sigma-70 factor (ECF subfamily)